MLPTCRRRVEVAELTHDQRPVSLNSIRRLRRSSVTVEPGSTVNVIGTVTVMSDSILAAWDEAGAFANEGDRIVAEFAERFVELRLIEGYGVGTEGETEGDEVEGDESSS